MRTAKDRPMNSPDDYIHPPLTAFEKLVSDRETKRSNWRWLADYWGVLLMSAAYGVLAWSEDTPVGIHFLLLISFVFELHGATEERAERRHKELERRSRLIVAELADIERRMNENASRPGS